MSGKVSGSLKMKEKNGHGQQKNSQAKNQIEKF